MCDVPLSNVKDDKFLGWLRLAYPRLKFGTCAALVLLKRIMNEGLRIVRNKE